MFYVKIKKDEEGKFISSGCFTELSCSCLPAHLLKVFLVDDVSSRYQYFLYCGYNPLFYVGGDIRIIVEKEDGYMYLNDAIFITDEEDTVKLKMSIEVIH